MKSRTSFFNLTALRKDITRFAPVWALYLIGGLLVGLTTLSGSDYMRHEGVRALASSIGALTVVNLVYAIISAELLFGDLFNSRLCNALHAFPLRRESWFATHTVAGLLFSFVPNLILSICFLPMMGELWYISFLWLLGVTLTYVFFFALAAFSAMCTGNRFAMAAVYTIINFASMIVYWFVATFYEPLLTGLHIRESSFSRLCPAVWAADLELVEFTYKRFNTTEILVDSFGNNRYYDSKYVFQGLTPNWWYLAIIAVIGVVLLGAALLLYRRRKLESAGDFVAFSWLKPIFSVVFTLCMGAAFELFADLFISVDYVFLAVGIVVGYFVGQMLLQRTVRVFHKRTFANCIVIGALLVISICLTAIDPLGITRWTPKPEKVESITLSSNYYYQPEWDYKVNNAQVITTPALIEDLVEVHELLIEEEWNNENYLNGFNAVHLTYKMSDGRQIVRRYYYYSRSVEERMNKFFSAPEFVLGYEDWEDYLATVDYLYVADQKYTGTKAIELLTAIKKDCEAGTMTQSYAQSPYRDLNIYTKDGDIVYIQINRNCTNAIAWFKENE